MAKLLMITGDRSLAEGKRGAFYNTLEGLREHFDRIDVICPRPIKDNENKCPFQIFLEPTVFLHWPPQPQLLLYQPQFILQKGLELNEKYGFDLITVHEYPPFYNGIGARWLWNKIKVPYILEIHHIVGYPRAANLKEFIYRIATRFFIKPDSSKAKAVRVVNKDQAKDFLIRSGISESKIKYIPSMYIDLEIFKPMDLPKEYDLIFVGRLEPNKGIALFLEAVKKLKCKALIVGDGSLYKKIKSENDIQSLGIEFSRWIETPNEVSRCINKSKILVMPSYNEGGPRVVFEAMACGVPVLATPVGLVPDFKSSATIINWDAEDIVLKAKKLLTDKNAYESIKNQGLLVARQFEKKMAIKNYADKIKQLI